MNAKLANQLEQLNGVLESLFQELEGYPDDQLNKKPSPESWSAIQTMHHMMRSEHLSFLYVQKKLSFQPKLKKADWVTGVRQRILNFYLNTPLKFRAPKGVSTEYLPDRADFSETREQWKKNRKELEAYIRSLPEEMLDKEIYKHPFAGRLTLNGMLVFFREHFERHRKQALRAVRH